MDSLARLYVALSGRKKAPENLEARTLLQALEAAGAIGSFDWKKDPSEIASRLVALAARAGVSSKGAKLLLDLEAEDVDAFLS